MFHRKLKASSFIATFLVALLCSGQYAAAEIPHENFDLVGSDLTMVIQLLRQGINSTELALGCCLIDRPDYATHNMSELDSIITPVRQIIFKIERVATSYNNLTYLIPPFENLSAEGGQFIKNQTKYLTDSYELREYIGGTLSPAEKERARFLLVESRTVIFSMNSILDRMDFSADEIANLTVENEKVFDTAYLKELIDRLRILIEEYQSDVDKLFFHINWGKPVLLLVTDRAYYYLGETVKLAGYLSNGTTPLTGKAVYLWKDFLLFDADTTDANGEFDFSWHIPIDPVELGRHNLTVDTIVEGLSLSDNREIYVLKIPTKLTFVMTNDRFSPGEKVVATAYLQDYRERYLVKQIVLYCLDGRFRTMMTSGYGSATWMFNASELDWGGHNIFVQYNGSEIYEACICPVTHFDINLLTSMTLELSSYRVRQGENVTAISRLYLNGTIPIPDMSVVIKIDGAVLAHGQTLLNGSLIAVIHTANMSTGAHILRAYFSAPEPKYKDAISEPVTLIIYVPSSYENQENNNWWGGIAGSLLWILLLIFIILVIAIMLLTRDTVKSSQPAELRKKAQLKLPEAALTTSQTGSTLPAPYSPISNEIRGMDLALAPPKIAIITQYGALLDFLRDSRGMPIQANMTAREIAALLVEIGYPSGEVWLTTKTFEKARYSTEAITADDWGAFKNAIDVVIDFGGSDAK